MSIRRGGRETLGVWLLWRVDAGSGFSFSRSFDGCRFEIFWVLLSVIVVSVYQSLDAKSFEQE